MSKEAVFTMKLEPELREQFMAEAEASHRPASQILRELMREFIERQCEARAPLTASLPARLKLAGTGYGQNNCDQQRTQGAQSYGSSAVRSGLATGRWMALATFSRTRHCASR